MMSIHDHPKLRDLRDLDTGKLQRKGIYDLTVIQFKLLCYIAKAHPTNRQVLHDFPDLIHILNFLAGEEYIVLVGELNKQHWVPSVGGAQRLNQYFEFNRYSGI